VKSTRTQENELLLKHIETIHDDSRGTYGWPRVHAELTLGLGIPVNHKRVARLMREAGIYGKTRRRAVKTTIPDPDAAQRPDLVKRDFHTDATALDTRWCGDITYIQTWRSPVAGDRGTVQKPSGCETTRRPGGRRRPQ
jgi:putative transposase